MDVVIEQSSQVAAPAECPRKRAPTLYAIIVIKLGKGLLLLMVALGVYSLANADLSGIYQSLLKWINVDPEQQFFVTLAKKISAITPANVYWVAAGTAFYSLFSLVEGVGLMFRVGWAGWLAIGESAFFIPIEVHHLIGGFSSTVFFILLLNVGIVWYLLQNRHRLFKHH
jgi:uncharacterized membrane protein (DUF2068 family)